MDMLILLMALVNFLVEIRLYNPGCKLQLGCSITFQLLGLKFPFRYCQSNQESDCMAHLHFLCCQWSLWPDMSVSVVCVYLLLCGFVEAMLCTTLFVQSYVVHHRPALCTTNLHHGAQGGPTFTQHTTIQIIKDRERSVYRLSPQWYMLTPLLFCKLKGSSFIYTGHSS